eukprot:2882300-Rhodomonas_salina.1
MRGSVKAAPTTRPAILSRKKGVSAWDFSVGFQRGVSVQDNTNTTTTTTISCASKNIQDPNHRPCAGILRRVPHTCGSTP